MESNTILENKIPDSTMDLLSYFDANVYQLNANAIFFKSNANANTSVVLIKCKCFLMKCKWKCFD